MQNVDWGIIVVGFIPCAVFALFCFCIVVHIIQDWLKAGLFGKIATITGVLSFCAVVVGAIMCSETGNLVWALVSLVSIFSTLLHFAIALGGVSGEVV